MSMSLSRDRLRSLSVSLAVALNESPDEVARDLNAAEHERASMKESANKPVPVKPEQNVVMRYVVYFLPELFALGWVLLAYYVNSIVQFLAQKHSDGRAPLTDRLFEWWGRWRHSEAADYYLMAILVLFIVRFGLDRKQGATVFRRWLFLNGVMFFLRAVSVLSTDLPNPLEDCEPTADLSRSMFVEALFIMSAVHRTCCDVMFSGHTSNATLMVLFLDRFTAPWLYNFRGGPIRTQRHATMLRWTWFVFVWANACGEYVFLILTHFHYTVDVVIALFLSFFVFSYYEYRMRNLYLRTTCNLPPKTLMHRFEEWFEQKSTDLLVPGHWKLPQPDEYAPSNAGAMQADQELGWETRSQTSDKSN